MKLKAIIRFRDLEADVIREIGAEWSVTKKRGEFLLEKGWVEAIPEKKQTTKKDRE